MNADWIDYPRSGPPLAGVPGRLKILRDLESPRLGNRRDIVALLPPGHGQEDVRYPVVYMHDGQNLFDPATSFGEDWRADRALERLTRDRLDAILVGIPNAGPHRIDEYGPFRDPRIGGGQGDAYLDFILETVKPAVDAAFRTRPEPGATAMAGSSMGGLISLYAFFARPGDFAAVGALSPALWFARRALFEWIEARPKVEGRIYLDAGTGEGAALLADVTKLRDLLLDKGYRRHRDLRCIIDPGGRHDENSWGRRLPAALRFMLGGANLPPEPRIRLL